MSKSIKIIKKKLTPPHTPRPPTNPHPTLLLLPHFPHHTPRHPLPYLFLPPATHFVASQLHQVAAIKLLKEAIQGEAEFLAEISTIGRLNHVNLIEIWGYSAEGKHRLLVYEYMKHGSLAKSLYSGKLDWWKRYEIALGTARGLAYLHEECLEWVLHCDVKPQNILLNSDYLSKVADFGLSKLLKRSGMDDLKISRIRGTEGTWLLNGLLIFQSPPKLMFTAMELLFWR